MVPVKRLKLKMSICVLLAAAITAGCFFALRSVSKKTSRDYQIRQRAQRISGMNVILGKVAEDFNHNETEYENGLRLACGLKASVLREYAKDGAYTGPELFENAAVCTVRDGKVLFPAGMPIRLELTASALESATPGEMMTVAAQAVGSEFPVIVFVEKITEDRYLVLWDDWLNKFVYAETDNSLMDAYREIGEIYDGVLVNFTDEGSLAMQSKEGFLPYDATIGSLHLSETASAEHPGVFRGEDSQQKPWYYVSVDCSRMGLGYRTGFFFFQLNLSEGENTPDFTGQALLVSAVLALIAVGLIVWLISIQRLVRDSILDADQFERYHPEKIRRLTLIFGGLGCAAVLLTAILTNSIDSLRVELARSSALMNRVAVDTDWLEARNEQHQKAKTKIILNNARLIRDSLEENPAIATREKLAEINALFGSEYIMIYDHAGRETVCSTDYTDFTLGTDETDEMAPFRRLTMGVESIVEPPRTYEILGREIQKIGLRIRTDGGFGALIFAMDPAILREEPLTETHSYTLLAATQEGCVSFAADQTGGDILYASDSAMIGKNVSAYGLEHLLGGNSPMCSANVNGVNYYGVSVRHGQRTYFYFFSASFLGRKLVPFIWVALGFALLLCLALGLTLLWGYSRAEYEHFSRIGRETLSGRTVEIVTADGRRKRTVDPYSRWSMTGLKWRGMMPEQKVRLALQIVLVALSGGMLIAMSAGGFLNSGLIRYIMTGNWQRGLNLFAMGKTVLITVGTMLALLVLRIIMLLACQSMGTKGETILRMVYNLLQYIAVFTVLYYGFEDLGLETNALLGAMGAITLAVSLGSKDIMADILAGVNIVVEGEFQVGDIVEINKVKGKIMDVGIRTTKLLCQGDNVKIINNRFITDVVNMTRFNSWYAIEVSVSTSVEVAQMEKTLREALPEIGKRIPNIISGPIYKGIESFGKGSYSLLILAECREENFNNVHRNLNREIRMLLEKEKIPQ